MDPLNTWVTEVLTSLTTGAAPARCLTNTTPTPPLSLPSVKAYTPTGSVTTSPRRMASASPRLATDW